MGSLFSLTADYLAKKTKLLIRVIVFGSGSDMKTWVDCIKSTPDVTATDMLLQIVQVALHTQALHLTKG